MAAAITLNHICPGIQATDVLVFWGQPPTSAGRGFPNKRWRRLLQRSGVPINSNTQLLNSWTPVYGAPVAGQRLWVMVQIITANGSTRGVPMIATCIVS